MVEAAPPSEAAAGTTASKHVGTVRLVWLLSLIPYAILLTTFRYTEAPVWHLASPERMASFTAAEPFQHRILLPAVVAGLNEIAPWFDEKVLFAATEVAAWMLLVVVAYHALAVFRIGSSDLVRRLLAMTVVVPVAMHLIVPDIGVPAVFSVDDGILTLGKWRVVGVFRYVYDLPAAVLTLALVALLARFARAPGPGTFAAYIGLFAVATMNRETTLFLIPAFLLVCRDVLDRVTLIKALAVQGVVFLAVFGAITTLFPGFENPRATIDGTHYEDHFATNLEMLSDPFYLLVYLIRFGAGLYLAVLLLYRYLDPKLKATLIGFGIPFVLSAMVFGRLQEHRVVVELIPLLWLGALQVLTAWATGQARPAALTRPEVRQP